MSNFAFRSGCLALSASILLTNGCATTLPTVEYADTWFGATGTDPTYTSAVRRCIHRLNQHRNTVVASSWTSTGFAIASAALGGTTGAGGGLAAVLSANDDVQQIGGILAIVGGVVGAIGSAISIGLADPQGARLEMYYASLGALERAEHLARTSVQTSLTVTRRVPMNQGPTWEYPLSSECANASITSRILEGSWCRGAACTADGGTPPVMQRCSVLHSQRGEGRRILVVSTEDLGQDPRSGECTLEITCPRAEALEQRDSIIDALQSCERTGSQPRDRERPIVATDAGVPASPDAGADAQ